MKLNEPETKIKCTATHLKTLLEYLAEIVEHHDDYLKTFVYNSSMRRIYRYHLNAIRERVIKILFTNAGTAKINFTLKINQAERITLYSVSSNYPLPLDINFIEYEIKNRLLI